MNKEEFFNVVALAMEQEEGSITGQEQVANIDSIKIMGLIGLIDEKYNVTVTPEDFQKSATVLDLFTLVQERKG